MDWREIEIAPDGTHHLHRHEPIYDDRFDEVLKFHAPGLAPVRKRGRAWHIDTGGRPAYARRFARTFGFYEGRAAVQAADGWHHILPEGADAYPERYAWCGNYQDGFAVARTPASEYLHVGAAGAPLYARGWRYAGDFRDGTAVVQAADGRSTHIDPTGALLHSKWFLDLDVFHKGFARARDSDGWTHVDRRGLSVYRRRFLAVEPFYNGQARVERFDGGLEVIDETGHTLVEPRHALRDEFAELSADLVGYWRTQTIRAAVEMGVFDELPTTGAELARRVGADPARMERLLHALGELHLVESDGAGWRFTPRGTYLRAAHPASLAGAATEYGGALGLRWTALGDAMRSGTWRPKDVWAEVARDPERIAPHHEMLRSYATHDYASVSDLLDLDGVEVAIDAGGGLGVLSRSLLRSHPSLRIVLLDRSEVAERVRIDETSSGRLCVRAGNLHAAWGVTGDAVILARVLHDWDDPAALGILRRAREALPVGGRIFIIEMLLERGSYAGALCDLHLLVTTGGRERTADEYARLLAQSGFSLRDVRRLSALQSIVEGVAA